MKFRAFVLTGFLLVLICKESSGQQLDIKPYLQDSAFMNRLLNCMLNRGECDGIGNVVKSMAKSLITTRCATCEPQIKNAVETGIYWLQSRYNREWNELVRMYA
ncbi:uncharacterized protein LOC132199676 [Neocloeon triangulifer]|uniref:uncharacterized protein LOC132199676 n=1 Tax=Neocloeon triangulifer TaxID=2078957 RepID=UPI00286F77D5|nr:uncharacterized protein LOC132199676 [Neocloeon triangulifer]